SAKFYTDVFGWDSTTDEQFDYTIFESGNVPGAFPNVNENVKAGSVIVYLDSDNIEADLENIKKHGGTPVDQIHTVPGMGRYAQFTDPGGNLLALWQNDPQAQ